MTSLRICAFRPIDTDRESDWYLVVAFESGRPVELQQTVFFSDPGLAQKYIDRKSTCTTRSLG